LWAAGDFVRKTLGGPSLYLRLALSSLAIAVLFFAARQIWSGRDLEHASDLLDSSGPPFTGAFARFPRLSELPERQRRLTIVGAWNDDDFPEYLRHFFYTIQLNADVLDLLMINRLRKPDSQCLDFAKAEVNITWGGNIKFHCMDDFEWRRRHVDFMCSSKYGWNCNSTEYREVTEEYADRPDKYNFDWRPFRGYVFRDLFTHHDNPFWAWMDHDIFVGNFARYPFNILSGLSILTGSQSQPEFLFMAGQLTAFNIDDEALGTAWKRFPSMKSASHFTKYIDGKTPNSAEEQWWSYGYLRSDEDLPGAELSYGIYPDIHGDDYYYDKWNRKDANQTYLISGRDILLASTIYTREEVEEMLLLERNTPIDDLGGIGWTGGEDGSAYLLDQPNLDSSEAKLLAINKAKSLNQSPHIHKGIVEDQLILTNCTAASGYFIDERWKQCVIPHPLTVTDPPLMRASLVHFKEQQAGHLLRRLEKDKRPRGYERKLFKHHLKSKSMKWFELPPFEITEDLVLRYNSDFVEVFKMGPSRNETLFYRKEGEQSVG
jgi:hypothetical protein